MDELKHRAGEKLEALHIAAKTAADGGKTRVNDVVTTTSETIRKLREAFQELWENELFMESRLRVAAWTRDAVQRIRDGTPPLSPVLLYEELVALFKDRVWRRSVLIFLFGACVGGGAGLALGLRAAAPAPVGPRTRALHSQPDQSVMLVEDAVTPGAGAGEVLVRVQAVSVCARDRGVLRGRGAALRSLLGCTTLTVGRGFAGVVLDVGPGVSLELGDEVWGCVSEWAGGAAAELLTVRSTLVSKRPRSLQADGAASLPWAGTEALAALEALNLTPETAKGKRVAICGAASGEGCALVQLLAAWGAHVTALAPRRAASSLQELGAQEFLDSEALDTCLYRPLEALLHFPIFKPTTASGQIWASAEKKQRKKLGAHEFLDSEALGSCWVALEQAAARAGPWHAALAAPAALGARPANAAAILKATAPRDAIVDLRPRTYLSDRLPAPLSWLFAASFCSLRVLRWAAGRGWHVDWLEPPQRRQRGLEALATLVDERQLAPVLDKVYMPQDFENALAHACSEDAIGTTVIRFP